MDETKKQGWITEGLVLALIPVLGYFFAFQYEAGYASYFKYPKELIDIGLPQIVIATITLWTGAIMIFMFIESITMTIPKAHRGLSDSLIKFLPLAGFFIGSLLVYGWDRAWPFLLVFFLIGIPEFILPLLTQKDRKTYSEKIEADWDSEWRLREAKNVLSWRLLKMIGHKNIILVINIFIVAQLVQTAGEVVASRQIRFFTMSSAAEKVVLRIYNDKLICADFDRKTKTVKSGVAILKPDGSNVTSLKLEMLGPLKMERL